MVVRGVGGPASSADAVAIRLLARVAVLTLLKASAAFRFLGWEEILTAVKTEWKVVVVESSEKGDDYWHMRLPEQI